MNLIDTLPIALATVAIAARLYLLPRTNLGMGAGPAKAAAAAVKSERLGLRIAYRQSV